MKTRCLALLLVTCLVGSCSAQVTVTMNDKGVVAFSDGQPLGRAVVNLHAPEWAGASNEGDVTAERDGSTVEGMFGLPGKAEGSLLYSVTCEPHGNVADLAYEIEFTDATDIFGAYVSFLIPADRFEGKRATLLHSGASKQLPRGEDSAGLSETASALAIELGDGKSFVIASDTRASVLVQNNRVYGSSEFEVRFHVFGKGPVAPGMVAQRRFKVAVVPTPEVAQVAESMRPKVTFDPDKPYAVVMNKGNVRIGTRSNRFVDVSLAIHGVGWAYATQGDAQVQATESGNRRYFAGTLNVPASEGRAMKFLETAGDEDGALSLAYELNFPAAVRLNGYQVSFSADLDDYSGVPFELATDKGTQTLSIPQAHEDNFLYRGKTTRVAVAPGSPKGFVIDIDQLSDLLVQDNRGWGGDTIEFRFNFRRQEEGEEVPAGEKVSRQFSFRLNTPLQIALNESASTSETDTSNWVAYTLPWDTAPIDVSFLNHKPAGKFGFVTAEDGKFILADTGEEIRFWGTCFSAGANFPSHEQSEKIATRLARFGINMVRTHHADARWSERHFFPKSADNTRTFDAENLDRFDYLISCLKNEGIYIYLDQLVNRYFKPGDEVDAVEGLGACGKPYSNFDPRLIELQKEFSRNLWNHVNPYTKLAYKDEPAVALMEFANENDLFTQQVELEPYRTRFEAMYRAWAKEEGVQLPDEPVNFRLRTDSLMRFLVQVQRDYYLEMERYLRDEVGVRVPMTGSNWSRNAALLAALRDMQYTDSHTYWNHPSSEGVVGNSPMVASRGTVFDGLGFQRLVGKPFFVSEWDEPWPNEWRAELPVWMAAIAAFQEWNGLTVYTYRHSSAVPIDTISGAFETFNDPARFGLFAHAALMFRRGDVSPAQQRVAVHIPEELAVSRLSPSPWGAPAYRSLSEVHRFDTALFDRPDGYDSVVDVMEASEVPDDIREADTKQLRRDIKQRVATVDAPRSQAVLGFLKEAGTLTTTDLTVDCETPFATIAVSALDDEPIRTSSKLLLAAVGRAENSGYKYSLLRNKTVARGTGPILIEPIQADVSIRTSNRNLKVRALGNTGEVLSEVPSSWRDGTLTFQIGPKAKTMYYAIEE